MFIQKNYSDMEDSLENLYSVTMNDEEYALYSAFADGVNYAVEMLYSDDNEEDESDEESAEEEAPKKSHKGAKIAGGVAGGAALTAGGIYGADKLGDKLIEKGLEKNRNSVSGADFVKNSKYYDTASKLKKPADTVRKGYGVASKATKSAIEKILKHVKK